MRVFLDSGVFFLAFKAKDEPGRRALSLVDDTALSRVTSRFLELEILPKAKWFKNADELAFYRRILGQSIRIDDLDRVTSRAELLAGVYGMKAMDALHVATALIGRCDELVTTELPTKPMFRAAAEGLRILHLG